ncbi:MAG: hypothetical protein BVN35_09645 [Proteobacteria bacterium ST_bin11]|nr:MAG: hypothetical protein BVN35_09645 [Proteobacteria bacterium ST_bin11]
MAISPLPPVPLRSDTPAVFIAKADAFLGALSVFRTEANAVAEAMNLGAVSSISTTNLSIGFGTVSLTVQPAKSYVPGMTVKIASTANGANWMLGDVISYSPISGALVVESQTINGSGAGISDWTISQSAPGNTETTGLIAYFPRTSAPIGWFKCDGSSVSVTTYWALYNVLGTAFGGDGVTTFSLPDLRGEFIRGMEGSVRGVDVARAMGSAQSGSNAPHIHPFTTGVQSHDHTHTDSGHLHPSGSYGILYGSGSVPYPSVGLNSGGDQVWSHTQSGQAILSNQTQGHYHTGNTGSQGVEARPRNIALLPCIKY